jgi:hypothetical protein
VGLLSNSPSSAEQDHTKVEDLKRRNGIKSAMQAQADPNWVREVGEDKIAPRISVYSIYRAYDEDFERGDTMEVLFTQLVNPGELSGPKAAMTAFVKPGPSYEVMSIVDGW